LISLKRLVQKGTSHRIVCNGLTENAGVYLIKGQMTSADRNTPALSRETKTSDSYPTEIFLGVGIGVSFDFGTTTFRIPFSYFASILASMTCSGRVNDLENVMNEYSFRKYPFSFSSFFSLLIPRRISVPVDVLSMMSIPENVDLSFYQSVMVK
jgi:hypothetical protein